MYFGGQLLRRKRGGWIEKAWQIFRGKADALPGGMFLPRSSREKHARAAPQKICHAPSKEPSAGETRYGAT
jgi:hypothetical protein